MQLMSPSDWSEHWDSRTMNIAEPFVRAIIWRTYKRLLKAANLSEKSHILELGAGLGKNSLKIALQYGSKTTLVDNCETALESAKILFSKKGVSSTFILENMFSLSIKERYDLVFSEGLLEHFLGEDRKRAFEIHSNLVKKGGHILIIVPFQNEQYSLHKRLFQIVGKWCYQEKPFSEEELIQLCKANDLKPILIAHPFFGSWIAMLAQKM